MYKVKGLLLLSSLLFVGLNAQQPLWHISLLAEETLNEVGQDKITTAWFVTGRDTVYNIHLQDSKIVGRTTPYDFDTIWTDGDSLYQQHIDFLRNNEQLAAYKGRKNVVVKEYASGELVKKVISHYGDDWKPTYERIWTPKELIIIEKDDNQKLITVKDLRALSTTYKSIIADTIQRWDVEGSDTVRVLREWKNYSEQTKFHKRKWTKWISIGDTSIRLTHYPEKTDSIFEVRSTQDVKNEHYHKQKGVAYNLKSKYQTFWKDGERGTYKYQRDSDSTRHVWFIYKNPEIGINVTVPKIHWKYCYDSDSMFFKSYEIIYDEQDAQVGLKIKRKDGTTTTLTAPSYLPEPEAPENDGYPIEPEENYATKLKIASSIAKKIMVGPQSLDKLILDDIQLYEPKNEHVKPGEWWKETIIIEIGADKTISGVSRSPSSELWVDGFLLKTKGESVSTPKKLKTVLYYIDINGKKRKQKLDYILLPVELQARVVME